MRNMPLDIIGAVASKAPAGKSRGTVGARTLAAEGDGDNAYGRFAVLRQQHGGGYLIAEFTNALTGAHALNDLGYARYLVGADDGIDTVGYCPLVDKRQAPCDDNPFFSQHLAYVAHHAVFGLAFDAAGIEYHDVGRIHILGNLVLEKELHGLAVTFVKGATVGPDRYHAGHLQNVWEHGKRKIDDKDY
jgi:hypothetical protein